VKSCAYTGHVWHHRHHPRVHRFRYPVSIFYLDLDEIEVLSATLKLFGHNRRNLISFFDTDYLDRSARKTKDRLHAFLRHQGMDLTGTRVCLLTQCRVFGYVFNPVSFFYVLDSNDTPLCIVAEVSNTFGERYLYVLDERCRSRASRAAWPDGMAGGEVIQRYTAEKVMHVSPFISMRAMYDFRFTAIGERVGITIIEHEDGRHVLDAGITGTRVALSDRALLSLLLRYPWITAQVIAGIHWEALRLTLKRVRLFRQPPPTLHQQAQGRELSALALDDRISSRLADGLIGVAERPTER
jgi:uncharacterized protein